MTIEKKWTERDKKSKFTFDLSSGRCCLEIVPSVLSIDKLAEASSQVPGLRVLDPVEGVVHQLQASTTYHTLGYWVGDNPLCKVDIIIMLEHELAQHVK